MKKFILSVAALMAFQSYGQVVHSMDDSLDYATRRQAAWLSYEKQSVLHRNDPVYVDQLDMTGVPQPKQRRHRRQRAPKIYLYPPVHTAPMWNMRWASPYMYGQPNYVITYNIKHNHKRK